MSYRITPGKPLTGEVVRIAEIQYARAIAVLSDQPDGPYEAIHAARKRFKRLRGLLRLIRDAAPKFCARENARLRDMARTLSAVRDASALVEALDQLLINEATAANHDSLFAIRDRLVARRDRITTQDSDLEARITAAIATCQDGVAALGKLPLPAKSDKAIAVLAGGAAKNYGRAAKALTAAAKSDDTADWHDLRKHIKYHRLHVQLLSPAWPGEMGLRAGIAEIAGEALGDDHDLANLEALIATEPDTIGSEAEIAVLRTVMAARSKAMHDQVRKIVKNLLRDDKKLIKSRIAALWRDAAG